MTLEIGIINPGVLKLLADLEQLNLIRLPPETTQTAPCGGSEADTADECPICAAYGYKPNAETLAAMQEARDIMSGKIKAKAYHSAKELSDEILAEIRAEEEAEADQMLESAVC